jgi:ArsR family transcriptional regulator, arsenate/arsenite/antimonite-responsive transcriptional repressor
MPAGQVSEKLDIAPGALTFHFDRLRSAGLVAARREGRSMIYAAKFDAMNALLSFLTENCCQGEVEKCGPAICKPSKAKRIKVTT